MGLKLVLYYTINLMFTFKPNTQQFISFIYLFFIYWFERETFICCSTYLCIHWLILVYALNGDWTHNLDVFGGCSNQLNYPARTIHEFGIQLPLTRTRLILLSVISPCSLPTRQSLSHHLGYQIVCGTSRTSVQIILILLKNGPQVQD